MRPSREPKRMAEALRKALAEKNIKIGQGEALDIVTRQFGLKNWNVLAAEEKAKPSPKTRNGLLQKWWKSGVQSHNYEDSIDTEFLFEDEPSLRVKSLFSGTKVDGRFVTVAIMQSHEVPERAVPFLGQRVTFSAWIKTLDVVKHATLWMSIEGPETENYAASFLEPHGVLAGSNEWTRREITFDVPKATQAIRYGFILSGPGTAWFARPSFGVATSDAILTENRVRPGPKS